MVLFFPTITSSPNVHSRCHSVEEHDPIIPSFPELDDGRGVVCVHYGAHHVVMAVSVNPQLRDMAVFFRSTALNYFVFPRGTIYTKCPGLALVLDSLLPNCEGYHTVSYPLYKLLMDG